MNQNITTALNIVNESTPSLSLIPHPDAILIRQENNMAPDII